MPTPDDGYTEIVMVDGGGAYRSPLDSYANILALWKSGAAFVEWTGLFGQAVTVKAARIESVGAWTGEQLDASLAFRALEKKAEVIE